jgi:hypothetical protein
MRGELQVTLVHNTKTNGLTDATLGVGQAILFQKSKTVQKMNFSANWISRWVVAVAVEAPDSPTPP